MADSDPARPDNSAPDDIDPDLRGTYRGGSRDYADVGQAARQLGGPGALSGATGAPVRPVEESDQVAAAVDDEAPVPELAQTQPVEQVRHGQTTDQDTDQETENSQYTQDIQNG